MKEFILNEVVVCNFNKKITPSQIFAKIVKTSVLQRKPLVAASGIT